MLQKEGLCTQENYGTSGDKILHSNRLWGIFTEIFSACEIICVNPDLSVTKSLISYTEGDFHVPETGIFNPDLI